MSRVRLRGWLRALAWLLCLALLPACDRDDGQRAAQADAQAFSILAGSELKPLEAAIRQAAHGAGVELRFEYAGTLDIVERIEAGEHFDAILPPNGAYPVLALSQPPLAREKLFYSRVALGVKAPLAAALGWDRQAPSWADIAQLAGAGRLRYAMSNPTASNTGMSALFAVASAAAGKSEDLRVEEIDGALLRAFLRGQALTAGSSGWLADAFVREADRLDAMVNYEAVILQTNQRLPADAQLQLIYPRDGVISADYPLMLLNGARRAEYERLVAVLKAAAFQRDAVAAAYLRPSNPDAAPAAALPDTAVAELAFPNRLDVVDAVLAAYQSDWRRPATSILVLDVSGSMAGERLQSVRAALQALAGADAQRASARYARFQPRERVVLITFASEVSAPVQIDFAAGQIASGRDAVLHYAGGLEARGGTAVYDALELAERIGSDERTRDPQRLVSILLLTDGQSNQGLRFEDFRLRQGSQPWVRVFPILYGEGNVAEMQALAELTGGRTFDGRKTALAQVFKDIRGYQ